jgi:hypothetical protein
MAISLRRSGARLPFKTELCSRDEAKRRLKRSGSRPCPLDWSGHRGECWRWMRGDTAGVGERSCGR